MNIAAVNEQPERGEGGVVAIHCSHAISYAIPNTQLVGMVELTSYKI